MKHPDRLWKGGVVFVIVLAVIGCAQQQTQTVTKADDTPVKSASREMMKIAFAHPVVMVNGARGAQAEGEYQDKIEVSFPQGSTQEITLGVIADGEEKTLRGEIEVFRYTKFSEGGEGEEPEVVWVAPKNPEYVYDNIIRNGYGELTIREGTRHSESGDVMGPVVAKLKLGDKKKTAPDQIEFRFQEGSAYSVNGQTPPVSLSFPENSSQQINLTLDDGSVYLQGELQVFTRTNYTEWAPVWVTIPEATKEYLRGRGGRAELSMCVPGTGAQAEDEYVKTLDPGRDPSAAARQYGKLVALLKLRRVKQ